MTIAFEDYITEERKAEIAEAAFRDVCEQTFKSDAERIFSNAAHEAVWKIVDEMFDGKAADMIAEKIPKLIENLSEYSVFRSKDAYNRAPSLAQKAVDKAISENQDAINQAVKDAAKGLDRDYLLDAMLDADFTFSINRS